MEARLKTGRLEGERPGTQPALGRDRREVNQRGLGQGSVGHEGMLRGDLGQGASLGGLIMVR